jgi:hypothetical protein
MRRTANIKSLIKKIKDNLFQTMPEMGDLDPLRYRTYPQPRNQHLNRLSRQEILYKKLYVENPCYGSEVINPDHDPTF